MGRRTFASMGARWETTRTEAFTDGVFSIASTLLVLDIAIPASELDDLWRGIAHQWPAYLAYATSFITIGGLWLAHHGVFRRLQYANTPIMRTNLALLLAVAFLPFPTRLVADALRHSESSERAAVIFYGASLLLIALLFSALWRVVTSDRQLLRPGIGDADVAAIGRAITPNVGLLVVAMVVAILVPRVAAFGYLVIAIVAVARARGDPSGEQPA